ncbi:hypothetical protein KI387_003557 [Taxus chinensis]|uniref:Cytochrome P450 n=1 Tax=Taxus chinensis TaxID=29808 RepID=A0AA38GXU5_TAXCH|nr:hypothetical protein KI387_003557 [Taxus chinensis]
MAASGSEACFCIAIVAFTLLLIEHLFHNKKSKPEGNGFTHYPLLGILPLLIKKQHRIHDWIADTLSASPSNTTQYERPMGIRGYLTMNPANVEQLLKTNFENYEKGPYLKILFHDFLGRGIFNVDGELWKMQRKAINYEFNTKSLRSFVIETVQCEIRDHLVPLLSNVCNGGRSVNLQDVLQRFAFDNIYSIAFGVDPACLHPSLPQVPFTRDFDDATELSLGRMCSRKWMNRMKDRLCGGSMGASLFLVSSSFGDSYLPPLFSSLFLFLKNEYMYFVGCMGERRIWGKSLCEGSVRRGAGGSRGRGLRLGQAWRGGGTGQGQRGEGRSGCCWGRGAARRKVAKEVAQGWGRGGQRPVKRICGLREGDVEEWKREDVVEVTGFEGGGVATGRPQQGTGRDRRRQRTQQWLGVGFWKRQGSVRRLVWGSAGGGSGTGPQGRRSEQWAQGWGPNPPTNLDFFVLFYKICFKYVLYK